MKKAIKINLGGLIFHIDEDAYDILKNYLQALTVQFGNNTEAKEIVSDIEARMAELFQQRVTPNKQVLDKGDVDEIIKVLGRPSDFNEEENASATESTDNEPYYESSRRRFYRDIDNAVLGGVCSGLGAYMNVDPVLIRILFVLFFFIGGATFLIYLILWIALPAARTSAQKLEMRGEKVNISNIERAVKEEYEQVRKNMNKTISAGSRFRDFVDEVIHALGSIVKALFKLLGLLIGFVFIVVGIAIIIAIIAATVGHPWHIDGNNLHFNHFPFFLHQFMSPTATTFAFIAATLLVTIPILALLYLGLKLIFRFKTNDRFFWFGTLVTWIIAIAVFTVIAVTSANLFSEESSKSQVLNLYTKPYRVIYFTSNDKYLNINHLTPLLKDDNKLEFLINDDKEIFGRPNMTVEKSYDSTSSVYIEKSARGSNFENAISNNRNIQFDVIQKDSVVLIDPYFKIDNNAKWRAQQVKIKIKIPVGTIVYFDPKIEPLIRDADMSDYSMLDEITGKNWIMGKNGLTDNDQNMRVIKTLK